MGTKNTKLMRGQRYGLLKAAELAADMIGHYERARDGPCEMRVESPEEAVWDDIHVIWSQHTEKWQVKRLMQAFDHVALKELLSTPSPGDSTNLYLGVANLVPVKKGKTNLFGLHELAELCQEARKPGIAPDAFVKREQARSVYKFVESCFPQSTPESIIQTLQRLWIVQLGIEEKLRVQAVEHLRDVFINAQELVKQLHHWFLQYPDGTIRVDVHVLYEQVINPYGKRDPARPRWIHLTRDAVKPQWEARGPLEVRQLVEKSWGTDEGVQVQLGAPPFCGEQTTTCFSRLLLHLSHSSVAKADDAHEWQAHSLGLCGGTLGLSAELPTINAGPTAAVCFYPPREEVSQPELARILSAQMNDRVWKAYIDTVAKYLNDGEIEKDLQSLMQGIWIGWNGALAQSSSHRASFMRSMLATAEEWGRKNFDVSVRAGRLLVDDLGRATIVALAIAATLEAGGVATSVGSDGSVTTLQLGSVAAHVIALGAASHPNERKPWKLSDAPGAMLSSERGLAILGVVEASAGDLYALACEESLPFHLSQTASQNYGHTGPPFPILTACPRFRAALRKGLSALQQHLAEALGRMNDNRVESLRQAVQEALANG